MTIRTELHLACNDYRNGEFCGRLSSVELMFEGDMALHIECDEVPIERVRLDGREYVRIDGYLCLVSGYGTWVGNFCWDAAHVTPEDAARVLNHLRERHAVPESGWCSLWDVWESGREFTADVLRQAREESK